MGIEPTQSAWKAEVLPLNYTRNNKINGAGEGDRTLDSTMARWCFTTKLHPLFKR